MLGEGSRQNPRREKMPGVPATVIANRKESHGTRIHTVIRPDMKYYRKEER